MRLTKMRMLSTQKIKRTKNRTPQRILSFFLHFRKDLCHMNASLRPVESPWHGSAFLRSFVGSALYLRHLGSPISRLRLHSVLPFGRASSPIWKPPTSRHLKTPPTSERTQSVPGHKSSRHSTSLRLGLRNRTRQRGNGELPRFNGR